MAWSPDQDLVVFVTRDQKLLLMTREFDPVTEVAMCPEEFGEGKDQLRSSSSLKLLHFCIPFYAAAPVNVGWGQKETQFHGSLGKSAAKQPASKVCGRIIVEKTLLQYITLFPGSGLSLSPLSLSHWRKGIRHLSRGMTGRCG